MTPRPEKCPFCSAPVRGTGPVCEQCGFELDREWTPASEEEARAAFDPGQRACPVCGGLNPLVADYCSKCSAPVGDCAGWKPLESVAAQGFAIRRAAEGLPGMPLPARIGRVLLALTFLGGASLGVYQFGRVVSLLAALGEMASAGLDGLGMAALMLLCLLLGLGLTALSGYLGHCLLFGGSAGRGAAAAGRGAKATDAAAAPAAEQAGPARREGGRLRRGLVSSLLVLAGLPLMHVVMTAPPPPPEPADRQVIPVDPSTALWGDHGTRGLDLVGRGQYAEAVAELRLAVEERPRSAELHYALAYSLAMTGDHPGAIAECREGTRLSPDFAPLHGLLGAELCAAGDAEGAVKSCREAVRLAPKDANAHAGLGHALLRSGDTGGAVGAYREAVGLKPADARLHNCLADALERRGDHDAALASCREAIRLDPGLADARVTLGAVLLALGRDEEALAAFREGVLLAPDDWHACYLLARAHARKGDPATAAEFLGRALKLCPELREDAAAEADFQGVRACRELLDALKVVPAGQEPEKPEKPTEP